MQKKRITILIPIYNESGNIRHLVEQIHEVIDGIDRYDFSILFVDDGSSDDSAAQLEELAAANPSIGVIELSRNFGKEAAVSAGIDALDCDSVIIMDADLQHPPQLIPALIRAWEEGYEVVATRRSSIERQPLARRAGSWLFYRLLNSISEFHMEPGTTDFRLLDRIVVDALKRFHERNRMVRGLIDWMGFRRTSIEFQAPARHAGKARYGYARLFALAFNSLTSFSLFPLKIAGYLGLTITAMFGALLLFMLFDKFGANRFGFTPLAVVTVTTAVMNGIVLTCLGLVALYIGHIHTETINRPLYLVRKAHGRPVAQGATVRW